MRWLRFVGWWLSSRPIEADLAQAWRLLSDNPERVVLALGIFVRLVVYYENRGYFLDEASLLGNIAGVPIFDFSQPLSSNQLAPHGFLIVERAIVSKLGHGGYATRLFPLVSGITALVLFSWLARRVLPPRPALVALVLFAFSDDLVHYSSELKPYSLDLAIGLAVTLLAIDAVREPPGAGRAAGLAILAAVAPWFSFPSAFIIAGCGLSLILLCLVRRQYKDALIWGIRGALWLASFAASYRASLAILHPPSAMYRFWNFAFLPVWPLPMSLRRISESAGILLEIFVNPLNLVAPVWPWLGVMLPLLLMLAGGARLARQSLPDWALLVVPISLAVVASALKQYPLHGRLILPLVPALVLLVAGGTETIHQLAPGRPRLLYGLCLILLLWYPTSAALSQAAFPAVRMFNRHGDLHNNIFLQYGEPAHGPRERLPFRGDQLERVPARAFWRADDGQGGFRPREYPKGQAGGSWQAHRSA
jgi:hypothetical protein